MIGRHRIFVFASCGVNEEVETAIRILHFGKEVGLPFGLLQDIANVIATFRDAEIIESGDTGEGIYGENKVMNETGAVDGVLAVITGVVVAAGHVERARPHKGEELS